MIASDCQPRYSVWTNVHLAPEDQQRISRSIHPHRLIPAASLEPTNLTAGASDPACLTADIAFGQPAVTDVIASRCLRWVHLTSAGYTRYDREEVRAALGQRGGMMTNSSSVYADPCAQHVLAFMLAHNRRLPSAIDAQRSGGDWAYPALRPTARVLSGQSVLLVGFGAIGRRLAELLAPFGAAILAVRRHPTGTEPVPTVSVDRLNASLPQADHVVNLLPSAAGTEKMFDAGRFALMHPKAAFYNVGRGDTVDQDALLEALTCGRLAAAYLDVTSPEPLPRNHPLWNAPNCVITPHIAGGVQDEPQRLVDHFLANFARFVAGEPLHDRII